MILEALQGKERTFSDLLRATRLPRKTLSIRLKQLAERDLIVKDGGYRLNGEKSSYVKRDVLFMKKFSNFDKKKLVLVMLLVSIALPSSAKVFAMFFAPPPPEPPKPLGEFTVTVAVQNAVNVYGWQAVIRFDPQVLQFVEAIPGEFLEKTGESYREITDSHGYEFISGKSMFMYHVGNGIIIIAQSLLRPQSGKSGDGILAEVTFAYYTENYKGSYELVFNSPFFETGLRDINLQPVEGEIYLP